MPQLLPYSVLISRHGVGNRLGVGQTIFLPGFQTGSRQGDQLRVGAADVQASQRRPQIARLRQPPYRPSGWADVGRLVGQDDAQDGAQSEYIAALVQLVDLAARLLRRHVGRRTHHRAGLRLQSAAVAAHGGDNAGLLLLNGRMLVAAHLGQAPVHDLHLVECPDHHVGRLQVAVDYVLAVSVGQRLTDLFKDGQKARQVGRGGRPFLEQFGKGAALDKLHGEEGAAVRQDADLMNGRNARVLQLPRDLRFLTETPFQPRVATVAFQKHLDRQDAP